MKIITQNNITLTNVVDGKTPYFHTAWAYSSDGKDRFTTVYPNLNLLKGTRTPKSITGINIINQVTNLYWFDNDKNIQNQDLSVGDILTCEFDWEVSNPTSGSFGIQLNGPLWNGQSQMISITSNNNRGHSKFNLEVYSEFLSGTATGLQLRADYLPSSSVITISNLIFTKCSTDTIWMPSKSEVTTDDYPKYIGQYTNYMEVDSPNPQDYTWSLIRGNDGERGPRGVEGKSPQPNLCRYKSLFANNAKSLNYDSATNTYTIVNNTPNKWGTIVSIRNDSDNRIFIPFGSQYVGSAEIYAPEPMVLWIDFNSLAAKGSSWSGNDNDDISSRFTSDMRIPANTWTKVTWTTKNTSPKNTDKVDLIIGDSFCSWAPVGTTWKLRNLKIELGSEATPWVPNEKDLIGPQGPKGDRGNDGIAGKDGVGLKTTTITYGISDSDTAMPNNWSSQVPTLVKGKYLWTKTTWTYTDNSSETGYQKTYIAKDGNNGNDGLPGKDGVGIRNTTITYAAGTSGTVAPTNGWSSQVPNVPSGQYLWTKTVWEYTDNTSETGYSVAKMGEIGPKGDRGERGLQGPKGDQGIPGPKGADGKTQYTHIAYADTVSGSGFSQKDINKPYIGMYQDFNASDSQNPQDYRWTKWKGSDGKDGIPGPKGADGQTPYVHFAYADSPDGKTGFSLTQTGRKRYIGVLTNFIKEDSTNPEEYTWNDTAGSVSVGGRNLLKGSKGPFKPDMNPSNFDNCNFYTGETSIYLEQNKKYIVSAKTDGIFTSSHNPNSESDNVVLWLYRPWDVWKVVSDSKTGTTGTQFTWDFPTGTYHLRVNTYHKTATKSVWEVKIEEGTIKTDWTPAIEDVQDEIDSKADSVLTTEQINKLNEEANIIKAEVEAKAKADIVNNWIKDYNDFRKVSEALRVKTEQDLKNAQQRLISLSKNLGELSERWEFVDTYMSASNEGFVIGKQDGSKSLMLNADGGITMFSAGSPTMTISDGKAEADNGVFKKKLKVGRYIEQPYHLDPDINVIRYVGED